VVALLSLVVPWVLLLWFAGGTVYWLPFQFDFGPVPTYIYFVKFILVDEVVRTLTFVLVIAGAILLIAKASSRRLGASMVLAGVIASSVDFVFMYIAYLSFRPSGLFALLAPPQLVPLGLAFAFVAAVIGFTAKQPTPTWQAPRIEDLE